MWNEVERSLSQSMTRMLSQLASLLPDVVALVTALLLSALIAWVLAAILRRSLTGLDFDRRVAEWGFPELAEWPPSATPTRVLIRLVVGIVIFIGFLIGISTFDGPLTSEFVAGVFAYLPKVVAAIVVFVAGAVIARFLARSVLIGAVNMNLQYARLLSAGVKWLVIVLAATIAMEHLGLGGGIIRLAFGILFGGIVLALALAVGLGSKELVSRSLEREANKPPSTDRKETVGHL